MLSKKKVSQPGAEQLGVLGSQEGYVRLYSQLLEYLAMSSHDPRPGRKPATWQRLQRMVTLW